MYEFDSDRLAKVRQLEEDGVRCYPAGFGTPDTAESIRVRTEGIADGDLAALGEVRFAGRLLFKNEMGKAGFGRMLDRTEQLQIYIKKDDVGEVAFSLWKRLDLGDHVGVIGHLMRTRTGALSVHAREVHLLSKCVRSLPDKFHGLSDPETRQRQRYLDLFVNEEVRAVFRTRAAITRYLRAFFDDRAYLEVETPMMHPLAGGATARPFVTHHNSLDMDLFLRVAPELYLKRLIVGGFERVYEINRNFRNEGMDSTHNPEFTMLEFYQAYATWEDLVVLTEELLAGLVLSVTGDQTITNAGREISFARPFRQARFADLVTEATGCAAGNLTALQAWWATNHPDTPVPTTLGTVWEAVFDAHVEKSLIQPTFVTHYPVDLSPLARRNDVDPTLADRFELFVNGRELANGFTELNDPVDQAARFTAQAESKAKGNTEAMHFDADYIDALCFGMPPTAGEGVGIDRLAMLLTDSASIRDVILFPMLRAR